MAKAAPVRSLTIFLMKAGIKESDVLDDEASTGREEVDIRLDGKSVGTLYAKQTPITPPSWLKFFAGSAAKNLKLSGLNGPTSIPPVSDR